MQNSSQKLVAPLRLCNFSEHYREVRPNPSFEPTATGKPASAAQLKRWATQMRNAPCLRSTPVLRAERGTGMVAGWSPVGSQRTSLAPRSGWRVKAVGERGAIASFLHSNTPPAIVSAGCPSCGGQRTSSGGSSATNCGRSKVGAVFMHRRASLSNASAPIGLCSARPTLRSSGPACGRPLSSNVRPHEVGTLHFRRHQ